MERLLANFFADYWIGFGKASYSAYFSGICHMKRRILQMSAGL